jgi:L-fuculose-phosphate aldolase
MKVFAQKDAEEFVKTGNKTLRYNRELQLTPGARDILSEASVKLVFDAGAAAPAAATASTSVASVAPTATAAPKGEYEAIYNSAEAEKIKAEICEIGRRVWIREYVDGNGGNISARLSNGLFICTPTGVSKGFLTKDMLCLVDKEGKQLAGTWKRTSEFMTHAAIYNNVPEAKSVCHAHPVHATAFAIVGIEPPERLIPELEVFVGRVVMAPYATPGSQAMYDSIVPLAPKHQSILMANHGVICWGKSVEDAYFKLEITDAYCRTVAIANQLPNNRTSIPCNELGKLLDLKKGLGLPDERFGLKPVELCEVDPWEKMESRPSTSSTACGCEASSVTPVTNAEVEALVQKVTEEITKQLKKG